MRAVDLYAEEGCGLVPDLFWRPSRGRPGLRQAAFARPSSCSAHRPGRRSGLIAACIVSPAPTRGGGPAGIGFVGMGGKLAYLAATTRTDVSCSVGYYGMGIEAARRGETDQGRLVLHFAEQDAYCPQQARDAILPCLRNLPKTELYLYPGVDHAFARVGGMHFDKPAYLMAHERSIAALKRRSRPNFDLSALWDEHVRHEFDTRDVAATMATMVAEPYVNHVPTLTGVGRNRAALPPSLHHGNPPDMTLTPISRTVGGCRWSTSSSCASPTAARSTGCCRRPTHRALRGNPHARRGALSRRPPVRAHLLGPGRRAGTDRPARPAGPASRGGVESARKLLDEKPAVEPPDARWAASEGLGLSGRLAAEQRRRNAPGRRYRPEQDPDPLAAQFVLALAGGDRPQPVGSTSSFIRAARKLPSTSSASLAVRCHRRCAGSAGR